MQLSVAIVLRVIPVSVFLEFEFFLPLLMLLSPSRYGHDKAHFALYYLVGIGSGIAMGVYSWAAEETQHDVCRIFMFLQIFGNCRLTLFYTQNKLRAVVIAAMNMAAYTLNTILPNFVWKVQSLFLTSA